MDVLDLRGAVPAALPAAASEARGVVVSDSRLRSIPAWVGELDHVTMLDLAHNELASVPGPLGERLEVLYLGDNALTELPACVRALRRLVYLGADGNELTALPEWIGELGALVELRLQGNRLAGLPAALGALGALRALHLRDNALTELPALDGLRELRHLDVRGNALTELPLGRWPRLRVLDARANRITQVPEAVLALPKLEKLDLRWNDVGDSAVLAELAARGCFVLR